MNKHQETTEIVHLGREAVVLRSVAMIRSLLYVPMREAAPRSAKRFAFGQNWRRFIEDVDERRIQEAERSLSSMLGLTDLRGRSFLDIGCGSGLSSLAAARLGAGPLLSIDYDPESVAATCEIKRRFLPDADWAIEHGDVTDASLLAAIGTYDVVYAWGSLHHTGAMWTAIENTVGRAAPSGLVYLALYTTDRHSDSWVVRKRRYNLASRGVKRLMEARFVLANALLPDLLRLRNPLRRFREHKNGRGMAYLTDVRDWLGGYPFEHARIEEVLRFGRDRFGLVLENIATGEANTEYLFRKPAPGDTSTGA